jgi:hypothetical protein
VQNFFSRPVAAPLLLVFGIIFSQFGYGCLERGWFRYTPRGGAPQIISPATSPAVYWGVSAGVLAVGLLCIALSVYASFCLVRAYRGEGWRQFRPSSFGIVMFVIALIFIIAALLAGK